MNKQEKINFIRQAMPVTENMVYLNTGTCGPLSTITTNTLKEASDFELLEGRASLSGFEVLLNAKKSIRQSIATMVNATSKEIAITHHTSDGMNIIAHGLTWQAGDEIITTTLEHEGGLLPLYVLHQRQGVVIKVVDILAEDTSAEIVAKLEAAISPRTRLLAFSHVAWNTGQRLPLKEIVAMGHRHHVLSLVDGAQSAGVIPLDLPDSGVDFYAMPGQKWLCGVEGIGALYVRKDRLSQVSPTFIGFMSLQDPSTYDLTGYFLPAPSARRYEFGTVYRPGMKAMAANLSWLEEEIGWDWIYERIETLSAYLHTALATLPNVTIITPPGPQSGLTSFSFEGYDPARIMLKLEQANIVVRFIGEPYAVRVSTGFYNTEADIDRLIDVLKDILANDPDSLPEFEWAWNEE